MIHTDGIATICSSPSEHLLFRQHIVITRENDVTTVDNIVIKGDEFWSGYCTDCLRNKPGIPNVATCIDNLCDYCAQDRDNAAEQALIAVSEEEAYVYWQEYLREPSFLFPGNHPSHVFGVVDDCNRCINCEVLNGGRQASEPCPSRR